MTKVIVLVKNIDGGTGKFFFDIHSLCKESYLPDDTTFSYYCMERPKYRASQEKNVKFLHTSPSHYPLLFSFTLHGIHSYICDIYHINKLIQKERPQVVFGIDAYCNILILINKVILRQSVKVICTTHINLSSTIKEKSSRILALVLKTMIRFFYLKADALVCVSKQVSLDLKTYFNVKKDIQVIYYGNKSSISSISRKKERKNTILISIGRLVPQKDFETLINAFCLLNKKVNNCILWIVGDGEERAKLEKLVSRLGLQSKVLFLGWKQSIDKELRDADIFILSSKREGFPYVLLEALSAGMPIISTDSPYGPSEILDNGKYGMLVPMQDIYQMANAMNKIVSNQKLYDHYAQKSLERAQFFSLDKMLSSYSEVIQSVINKL